MTFMSILRSLVDLNVRVSRCVDERLFASMTLDGNRDFVLGIKHSVGSDLRVADIGGGKSPMFSASEVAAKRLEVLGVDIDPEELAAAPVGAYAKTLCADITAVRGNADNDVVIVQSLLEHVRDGRKAAEGIASFCAPGGRVYTFCPNRRAWFAIINRVLPERIKKAVLYAVFPDTREKQGFAAYYDQCTPAEMKQALEMAGLRVERITPYFISTYFRFFVPFHVFWRVVNFPLMKLWPGVFCETFSVVASKPSGLAEIGGSFE